MKELLNRFENKAPEIVFEWHDAETPAKGWVVINSLRGGAAGGGTRMRKGLDRREVESLAKTMEVKFSRLRPGHRRRQVGHRLRPGRSAQGRRAAPLVQGGDAAAQDLLRHRRRPQRRRGARGDPDHRELRPVASAGGRGQRPLPAERQRAHPEGRPAAPGRGQGRRGPALHARRRSASTWSPT